MRKKIYITILTVFLQTDSLAQGLIENSYISVGTGISAPTTKIGHFINQNNREYYSYQNVKDSYLFSVSIGKSFNSIRPELEYISTEAENYTQLYRIGKTNYYYNFNLYSNAYLFNLNYDFNQFSQNFKPYITGSFGLAQNFTSKSYLSSAKNKDVLYYNGRKTNNLALGLGAGTTMNINNHFSFDFSYRYLDFGKIRGSNYAHNNTIGKIVPNNLSGKLRTNMILIKAVLKF